MKEQDIPPTGIESAQSRSKAPTQFPGLDAQTILPGNPILQGKLPERVGKFAIKRLIGEGGMGVVGLGVETEGHAEKRRVAVKFLKRDVKGGSLASLLFEQECKSLARFNHDNIARFIDFGYHEGNQRLPYIVMEYVEDARLITGYCAGEGKDGELKPLNLEERLKLFLKVCEGIRHAHERNVIHRDISAKNVLVGKIDGKAVVKIIDFGISLHGEDKDLRESSAAGTPAYMSPEQLEGDPALVDQRSDIYALGILLCELMVGRCPYSFETTEEAKTGLQALRSKQTTAVVPSRLAKELSVTSATSGTAERNSGLWRRLARELRGDIDAIVTKATALNQDERYSSVVQLIEDLELHQEGKPLKHAMQPTTAARFIKYVRRNSLAVAATVAIVLLLTGLAAYGVHDYRKTVVSEARIKQAYNELGEANEKLDSQYKRLWHSQMKSYASTLATFPNLLSQGRLGEARAVLATTRHSVDKGWEWFHLLELSDQSEMVLGQNSAGFVNAIDVGPTICAVGNDHTVWFWQAKDGAFLRANAQHKVKVVACAADSELCHTLDASGRLISWSIKTGEFRRDTMLKIAKNGSDAATAEGLLAAAIHGKEGRVAVRWREGQAAQLGVFELASGKSLCVSEGVPVDGALCWREDGMLQTAEFQYDGSQASTRYRILRVVSATEGLRVESTSSLLREDESVRGFPKQMLSTGGREFLLFKDGIALAQWKDGRLDFLDETVGDLSFDSLAVTADGAHGVAALEGKGLYMINFAGGEIGIVGGGNSAAIGRMNGHIGSVPGLSITDRGAETRVVSASSDGTVRLWNPKMVQGSRLVSLVREMMKRWSEMAELEKAEYGLAALRRMESSKTGWSRTVKDGGNEGILAVFDAPPWILRTGCGDSHVETCSPREGLEVPPFLNGTDETKLESAPQILGAGSGLDGRFIAILRRRTVSDEIEVVAGDLLSGGEDAWVSPAFTPAADTYIAVSEDGLWVSANRMQADGAGEEVVLWDFREGARSPKEIVLRTGGEPLGIVSAVRFSPQGRWLAVGNSTGRLFLWNLNDLLRNEGAAGSVAFGSGIRSIAISHQQDKIAVALAEGTGETIVYSPRGFAFVSVSAEGVFGEVAVPSGPVSLGKLTQDLCWNPAGNRLASADSDGKLRVWAFRRDDEMLDCGLVLEVEDAHRSETAAPLNHVHWSADGRWLVTSNVDEGCYAYRGAESDEDWPRRRVQLEFDDLKNRVSSVMQLRAGAKSIPELKDLNPKEKEAVPQVAARLGAPPSEVTRWAWSALMGMQQLQSEEEFLEERKNERDRYVRELEADARGMNDADREYAIALGHYRLSRFGQARAALSRAEAAKGTNLLFRDLLLALMSAKEGNRSKALELINRRRKVVESDGMEVFWRELDGVLTSTPDTEPKAN